MRFWLRLAQGGGDAAGEFAPGGGLQRGDEVGGVGFEGLGFVHQGCAAISSPLR